MSKKAFTKRSYSSSPKVIETETPSATKFITYEGMAHYDSEGILTGIKDSHYVNISTLNLPPHFNFANMLLAELRHSPSNDLLAISKKYKENRLIFDNLNHPKTIPNVKVSIPIFQPSNPNDYTQDDLLKMIGDEKRPKLKPRKGTWSRRSQLATKEVSGLRFDAAEDLDND